MSGRIPPALTEQEWKNREAHIGWGDGHIRAADGSVNVAVGDGYYGNWGCDDVRELGVLIALANHAMPDADLRKITRAMVESLREVSAAVGDRWRWDTSAIDEIADILESYLPPQSLAKSE
jgi:hypothetical protein